MKQSLFTLRTADLMLERDLDQGTHTHTRYMDDCGGRSAYFNIIITVESGHWPLVCHLFEGASEVK